MVKKFKIVVIGLIIISFGLIAYAQDIQRNEKAFQQIVTEVETILLKAGGLIDKLPYADAEKAMQKDELRLTELMDSLKKFIVDYPNSKYTDDAAYILTLISKNRIENLTLFIKDYPNASLEKWTLDREGFGFSFERELALVNVARFSLMQALNDTKRYQESINEAKELINSLDAKNLSDSGYRVLSLIYYYLVKDYEALGNIQEAKAVCEEAISKLNNTNKGMFIKKLKEFN